MCHGCHRACILNLSFGTLEVGCAVGEFVLDVGYAFASGMRHTARLLDVCSIGKGRTEGCLQHRVPGPLKLHQVSESARSSCEVATGNNSQRT